MMLIPAALAFFISKGSHIGLSMYAIDCDQIVSRLVGLEIRTAKIASYEVGDCMADLATIAITGSGGPVLHWAVCPL